MLQVVHGWFSLLYQMFWMIVVGAMGGFLLSRRALRIGSAQLARAYYRVVVVLLALAAADLVYGVITGFGSRWNGSNGIIGLAGEILFGVVAGLSLRRPDRWEILREPEVFSARCMVTGFTFLIAGFTKALYLPQSDWILQPVRLFDIVPQVHHDPLKCWPRSVS